MATATTDQIVAQWNDRLSQLADAIANATPQATKIALEAVRVDGIATIVSGACDLAVGALAAYALLRVLRRHKIVDATDSDAAYAMWFIAVIVLGIATIAFTIATAIQLFDTWAWISLWRPELFIAHRLLKL